MSQETGTDAGCHACEKAGETSEQLQLDKCPICFRYFCDKHARQMSGRPFCSQGCAEYFFFAEPDE